MNTKKNFYHNKADVLEYIAAREGLDGRALIEILKKYLPPGSKVLEIGIGSGKDLDLLNETFQAVGSDFSKIFLEIYRQKNPHTSNLIRLDAVSLKTSEKFDGIYSNKVLHHLSEKNLVNSLKNQIKILHPNGFVFHTFWKGDTKRKVNDLHFNRYNFKELKELIPSGFAIVNIDTYKELVENDSIYLILQKI